MKNYVKPPKIIPIEFKSKMLSNYITDSYSTSFEFALKNSSFNLSSYKKIKHFSHYDSNTYILYNKTKIAIIKLTSVDYGSDKTIANLFYFKEFNRSDILNNLKYFNSRKHEITNNLVKDKLMSFDSNFEVFEDLGFSLDLPILTKNGWYSFIYDSYIEAILLVDEERLKIIVQSDSIIYQVQDIIEFRGKLKNEIKLSREISFKQKFFFCNENEISNEIELIKENSLFLFHNKYSTTQNNYFLVENINEELLVMEYDKDNKYSTEYEYSYIKKDKAEIKFFDNYNDLIFIIQLKEDKKNIFSFGQKISFPFNIKIFLDSKKEKNIRYINLILLENGELYMHIEPCHANNNPQYIKCIAKEISSIKLIKDPNNENYLIKTDKSIIYICEKTYRNFEIEYAGKGIPFFYKKSQYLKYTKYIYMRPVFNKENKRGNTFLFEEYKDLDFFDLSSYKGEKNKFGELFLIENQDFNIKSDYDNRIFVTTNYNTSNPVDMFISKSNYLIFPSTNKKEYTVAVKEGNSYIERMSFNYSEDIFVEIREFFKLTNLPLEIKYNNEDRTLIFVYKDYFVNVSCNNIEINKR